MNTPNPELIENCWSKVKNNQGADAYSLIFYESMFKTYPEIKPLFKSDMESQRIKLLNTLNLVINSIQDFEEMKESLLELGIVHKDLGIDAPMYDIVISNSVIALKMASNNTTTPEEEKAWEQAFRMISDTMLEAY